MIKKYLNQFWFPKEPFNEQFLKALKKNINGIN